MKKLWFSKQSLVRHELGDAVGGLRTAADLLKGSVTSVAKVEKLIDLGTKKLSGLLEHLDSEGKSDSLVGSYVLESFEVQEEGKTFCPWGKNVHGLLIYTEEGTVSCSINRDSSENTPPPESLGNHMSYSGTYEILELGPTIKLIHQIAQASDPKRIGQREIRFIRKENSKLYFTANGDFGEARLIWSRL